MRIKGTQRLQSSDDSRTRTLHSHTHPAQKAANPGTSNPFQEFQWGHLIIKTISKDCVTFFTPNNATGLKQMTRFLHRLPALPAGGRSQCGVRGPRPLMTPGSDRKMCASNTMTLSHSLQSSCPRLLYVPRTMGASFIRQLINPEG